MQLVEQLLLLPCGQRLVLCVVPRYFKDADRIDSSADGVHSRQALHTVTSLQLSPLEVVMQADSDPSAEGVFPRYMRDLRIEREVGVGRP